MAGEEEGGVVRVKVKKCDGALPVEFRSFAVDPQITSLEVLQHILIRAFDLSGKRVFSVSYLWRDRGGVDTCVSLQSDADLDEAFLSAAKPFLQLKMDVKPSEDSPVLEDWDIISPKDVIGSELLLAERTKSLASAALPFTQSLLSQVGRTLSRVQQALTWSYGEEVKPFKPPLTDSEFHSFLNGRGQLTRPEELRLRIYHGGVEPSLRKVVWRYLLNVYPDGLSGQQRMDYMKRKTREYEQLKREWTDRVGPAELDFIRGNVLKDVLRTDRAHPYYAGSEDSPHLTALTDLLTTFAITHPQISYCQGMSDIASPILAVMDNEAHAFICFCGIMKRLEGNFQQDGHLMSIKFQHLKLLLQYSDPEFYSYLVSRGADDLFFCYRWLLLELKREFAFDDALRMLEVTWSSLPPDPPETEVELLGSRLGLDEPTSSRDEAVENCLKDDELRTGNQRRRHMLRPSREEPDVIRNHVSEGKGQQPAGTDDRQTDRSQEKMEGADLGRCCQRQTSFGEFKYYIARNTDSFDTDEAQLPQVPSTSESNNPRRQSTVDSEDDTGERTPLIKDGADASSLLTGDRPVSEASDSSWPGGSAGSPPKSTSPTTANGKEALSRTLPKPLTSSAQVLGFMGFASPSSPSVTSPSHPPNRSLLSSPILSFGGGSLIAGGRSSSISLQSPSHKVPSRAATPTGSLKADSTSIKACALPPPQEFGKGNPFMLFLCLSILLEHRDHIIKNNLDYNEIAMHFDRLVRRHHLGRVLQRAKALFADYLQSEVWDSEEGDEVSLESPQSPSSTTAVRALYSPLASPPSSPNSTYNLTATIHSPSAQVSPPPSS